MARFTRMSFKPDRLGEDLRMRGGTFIDRSVNQTAITNSNATTTADHAGRTGRAYRCVLESSAKVVFPNTLIRNKTKFTLSYFVKTDSGLSINVFTNRAVGSIAFITGALHLNNNLNNFYVNNANTNNSHIGQDVSSMFFHFAYVFDGSLTGNDRLKSYINGVQSGTYVGTIPAATADLDRELSCGFYNNQFRTGNFGDLSFSNTRSKSAQAVLKEYNYARTH